MAVMSTAGMNAAYAAVANALGFVINWESGVRHSDEPMTWLLLGPSGDPTEWLSANEPPKQPGILRVVEDIQAVRIFMDSVVACPGWMKSLSREDIDAFLDLLKGITNPNAFALGLVGIQGMKVNLEVPG